MYLTWISTKLLGLLPSFRSDRLWVVTLTSTSHQDHSLHTQENHIYNLKSFWDEGKGQGSSLLSISTLRNILWSYKPWDWITRKRKRKLFIPPTSLVSLLYDIAMRTWQMSSPYPLYPSNTPMWSCSTPMCYPLSTSLILLTSYFLF